MILKINYYFQLTVMVFFALSNLLMFHGFWFAYSLAALGLVHLVSFLILMTHSLSRSGTLFRNWMLYLAGVLLVLLIMYVDVRVWSELFIIFTVPLSLILALFFVYNSFQLWKTREYDNA